MIPAQDIAAALTDNLVFRAAVSANLAMLLACKHDKPYEMLNPMLSTLARFGARGVRVCLGCGAIELGDGKGWVEPSSTSSFRLIMAMVNK